MISTAALYQEPTANVVMNDKVTVKVPELTRNMFVALCNRLRTVNYMVQLVTWQMLAQNGNFDYDTNSIPAPVFTRHIGIGIPTRHVTASVHVLNDLQSVTGAFYGYLDDSVTVTVPSIVPVFITIGSEVIELSPNTLPYHLLKYNTDGTFTYNLGIFGKLADVQVYAGDVAVINNGQIVEFKTNRFQRQNILALI